MNNLIWGDQKQKWHYSQSIAFEINAQNTELVCLRFCECKRRSTFCVAGKKVNFAYNLCKHKHVLEDYSFHDPRLARNLEKLQIMA